MSFWPFLPPLPLLLFLLFLFFPAVLSFLSFPLFLLFLSLLAFLSFLLFLSVLPTLQHPLNRLHMFSLSYCFSVHLPCSYPAPNPLPPRLPQLHHHILLLLLLLIHLRRPSSRGIERSCSLNIGLYWSPRPFARLSCTRSHGAACACTYSYDRMLLIRCLCSLRSQLRGTHTATVLFRESIDSYMLEALA